ncbi:hypothetical protein ACTMNS_12115 [Staphylococcus haemolyticus]
MTIKVKDKLKSYQDHKAHFAELVQNGASDEEQSKAFGEMFDALSNDLRDEISAEVNNRVVDNGILAKRSLKRRTKNAKAFHDKSPNAYLGCWVWG